MGPKILAAVGFGFIAYVLLGSIWAALAIAVLIFIGGVLNYRE